MRIACVGRAEYVHLRRRLGWPAPCAVVHAGYDVILAGQRHLGVAKQRNRHCEPSCTYAVICHASCHCRLQILAKRLRASNDDVLEPDLEAALLGVENGMGYG